MTWKSTIDAEWLGQAGPLQGPQEWGLVFKEDKIGTTTEDPGHCAPHELLQKG